MWTLQLDDSADGQPLASTVLDLFPQNFSYERLPDNWINALLRPNVVLAIILLYILSEAPLKGFMKAASLQPRTSSLFRIAVALHNFVLAVYSGLTVWATLTVVINRYIDTDLMEVYCDPKGELWHAGLGAWSTLFYVSKFYEFVDTWILVLKGKPASFLQVYHHSGVAFILWIAVVSQAAWLSVVVLLNATIHTLMYTYFFIKTVSPTTEIKAAKYLTMAQIGQFLTGIAVSQPVFWLEGCQSESSRFSLLCLNIYGFGLVALFLSFAKRKYKKG